MKRSIKITLFVLALAAILLLIANLTQAQVRMAYKINTSKPIGCRWTAPADKDLELYTVMVKVDGVIKTSTNVPATQTSYMLPYEFISALQSGRIVFGICAQDSAGNQSIFNWSTDCNLNDPCWSVVIDKIPPAMPTNNTPVIGN
jgi:hypothetical protein